MRFIVANIATSVDKMNFERIENIIFLCLWIFIFLFFIITFILKNKRLSLSFSLQSSSDEGTIDQNNLSNLPQKYSWVSPIDLLIILVIFFLCFFAAFSNVFMKNVEKKNNENSQSIETVVEKEKSQNKTIKKKVENKEDDPFQKIISSIIFYSFIFTMIIFYFLSTKNLDLKDIFGYERHKIMDVIYYSFLAFLIIAPFVYIIKLVLIENYFIKNFWYSSDQQEPVKNIIKNTEISYRVSMAFMACILAPIFEEVFFRGYIFPTLAKYIGSNFSIFLSSLIFALIHYNIPSIFPLFILALLLNIIYLRTKNILFPVFVHAFFNSIVIFVVIISGLKN